ncbi:DUF3558 domain-containing protein [Nocardia amikacinitolerans]|uniref:DUF3558 domain-containing protein n=1 Tax=Nocardia amikacinitolerans TaxID=756689 RepID=UPI0020A39178|nr:DUF3558 domain-containing protein [Nocardia amikacinitolerans]MCP2278760.1 Protein of unknown function (DUF3558) [Nocardia amikacinitolerans]
MRTADVLRTAAAGAAVIGLAAGCGSTVGGTAATPTTTASSADNVELFNPCTQLTDEVLRATGMDPATKSVTTDPAQGPAAWRVCGWYPPGRAYKITVYSTSHTPDESRANEKLTGFRDVTVGSRNGATYHDKSDTDGERCYVGFPAQQGMFEVSASWTSERPRTTDMCEVALEHAKDLEPHLPK